jgi:carbonic anhydrase/acetyltransferase-like protein (isoleucine patch superfamily)
MQDHWRNSGVRCKGEFKLTRRRVAALGGGGDMLVRHRGLEPAVDASAYVAPTAVLVGNVRIGPNCRILYGAVLDSEGSHVEIGPTTIVAENAVIRATSAGDRDHPVVLGDHVFVAPHATLLGCRVESCSYVATGATVLHGATVASGANVAVGALVHADAAVPSDFFVPPNAIAVGDPLELYAPTDAGVPAAIKAAGFAERAFGVRTAWEDRVTRYRQSTEVRAAELESHFDDVVLDGDVIG